MNRLAGEERQIGFHEQQLRFRRGQRGLRQQGQTGILAGRQPALDSGLPADLRHMSEAEIAALTGLLVKARRDVEICAQG